MNLKQKLRVVFDQDNPAARYIPRSLDGGYGWGVFDKKIGRFLTDSQVKGTSVDALSAEKIVH